MPYVTESVEIARPPEDVFDYISQASNLPVWDAATESARQIDPGPARRGTRTRGTTKILGKRFSWITEVTDFQRASLLRYQSVEGRIAFTITIQLTSVAGGTLVRYDIDAEAGLGGVFGTLTDPLVTKVQARTVRANLASLAGLLKADGSANQRPGSEVGQPPNSA